MDSQIAVTSSFFLENVGAHCVANVKQKKGLCPAWKLPEEATSAPSSFYKGIEDIFLLIHAH